MRTRVPFLSALVLIIGGLFPVGAHAVYIDSNVQCPPGGYIGQPCKDNTNGYVSEGACDSIFVCRATRLPSEKPPTCIGKPGNPDCPSGSPPPPPSRQTSQPIDSLSIPTSSLSPEMASLLSGLIEDTQSMSSTSMRFATSSDIILIRLAEFAGPARAGDPLRFSLDSYNPTVSTLFQALRDSARTLQPGDFERARTVEAKSADQRFASAGAFGGGSGSSDPSTASEEPEPNLGSRLAHAFAALLRALLHFVKAVGNIGIADFTAAGTEWAVMHAEGALFFQLLGDAIVLP